MKEELLREGKARLSHVQREVKRRYTLIKQLTSKSMYVNTEECVLLGRDIAIIGRIIEIHLDVLDRIAIQVRELELS